MQGAKLLAVSVDLDEIQHYNAIHGLEEGEPSDLVYARAIPRLVDWARQRGVQLTWFAVGRDLERQANAEAVRRLVAAGDELASHSYSHFYDLTRRSAQEMRSEIELGTLAIQRACGERAVGFRAPGYVVSDTLLSLLSEVGLSYDSSIFPCPSYYALKAAALAVHAGRGRTSRAILDNPAVLRAPTVPYRVGQPYWYRGTGILELPIQVTPGARLPFIGTALTLAGTVGARLLARRVRGQRYVNLELHGIDALDVNDGLTHLSRLQRDVAIPWHKKLEAIDAAVDVLLDSGFTGVCLREIAADVRRG